MPNPACEDRTSLMGRRYILRGKMKSNQDLARQRERGRGEGGRGGKEASARYQLSTKN